MATGSELEQTTTVKTCRERKPNFSDAEIGLILQGVCEHRENLLNRPDCSTSSNRKKDDIYALITERVNQVTRLEYGGNVERSKKEVKKKWFELKTAAMKVHTVKHNDNGLCTTQGTKCKGNPFTEMVLDILSGKAKIGSTDFKLGYNTCNRAGPGRQSNGETFNSNAFPDTIAVHRMAPNMNRIQRTEIPEHLAMGEERQAIKTEEEKDSVATNGIAGEVSLLVQAEMNKREGNRKQNVSSPHSTQSGNTVVVSSPVKTGKREIRVKNYHDVYGGDSVSPVTAGRKKKRERKQNFTEVEISVLLKEINKHRDVILQKTHTSEQKKQRHQQWMQILQQFHKSLGAGMKRTLPEIKKKWLNLKLLAIKEKQCETNGLKTLSSPWRESSHTEQVNAILDGTFDDNPLTEVQAVDFEAMLNLDASAGQNPTSLLLQSENNFTSLDHTTATEKVGDRKDSFTHAEVLCLLRELPKHRILASALVPGELGSEEIDHWQMIAEEINRECPESAVRKTWRDVQSKFRALKQAALAAKDQDTGSNTNRISQQSNSQSDYDYEYSPLVLDILNGGTKPKKYSRSAETGTVGIRKNAMRQDGSRMCVFPKRNHIGNATFSLEECECLVSEVENFRDVLLVSSATNTAGDVEFERQQHQTWRIITEKVNKCSARGIRWTAKELKQKWMELQENAKKFEETGSEIEGDSSKSVLFHKINGILRTVESSLSAESTSVQCDRPAVAEIENTSFSTDKFTREVSNSARNVDNNGRTEKREKDSGSGENFPISLKREITADHDDNIDEDADDEGLQLDYVDDDSQDFDYTPTNGRQSREYCLTRSSPRMQNAHGLKSFAGAPPLVSSTLRKKRKRKPNFTDTEVNLMLDIYEANKEVFSTKKLDSKSNREKMCVWQSMTAKVNESAGHGSTKRTVRQVRKKMHDMRSVAGKIWKIGGESMAKGGQSWKYKVPPFVERVVNMMSSEQTGSDSFEIYQDIAVEECNADENTKDTERLKDTTASIQKYMDSLVHVCAQLKVLGVDAGAMVFEDNAVMTCGSDRLKHITRQPHLASVLSAKQDGLNSTKEHQQKRDNDWEVTTLNSALQQSNDDFMYRSNISDHAYPQQLHPVVDSVEIAEPLLDDTGVQESDDDSVADESFPMLDTSVASEGSDEVSDVKQKLRAMLSRSRSSDADTVLESSSEEEFTPVGFHLQQPGSNTSTSANTKAFTCNQCSASFSHLSPLILHRRSHRAEEDTASQACSDSQTVLEEIQNGIHKLPVVLLEKLPPGIVSLASTPVQQDSEKPSPTEKCQSSYSRRRFACNVCGKRFIKYSHLKVHLRLHSGTRPFTCDLCPATFTQRGGLMLHKKSRHPVPQPQKSTVESRALPLITEEKVDVKEEEDDDNDVEDVTFGEDSQALETLQETEQEREESAQEASGPAVVDSRERRFVCQFCNKKFFTSTHLRQHVRIHTGERPFCCEICGYSFTQSTSLKIHKRKHSGERPYACDVCGYTFYCSSDVLSHKKKRHGFVPQKKQVQVDKYKCDICNIVFPDITRLKTHKRKHTGEKPFACDVCQRRFTEKHNLLRHKERHLGIKAFQCEVCGAKFTEKGNLKVHMRYHSGDKPFKCDFCDEAFYVTSTLKIHRRKHTGERPFLCDLCGASFTQGSKLRSHRRRHTGEKPYMCGECGERFKEKQQLNIHERKHTGVQPYTCNMCGKAMQKASHLANHIRLHTGEKPYTCEVCGEKFSRSDVLLLHRRKHSNATQQQNGGNPLGQTTLPNQTVQPIQNSQPNQNLFPNQLSHSVHTNPDQQVLLNRSQVVSTPAQVLSNINLSPLITSTLLPPNMMSQVTVLPPGYQHL